jgi:hypothetical protein
MINKVMCAATILACISTTASAEKAGTFQETCLRLGPVRVELRSPALTFEVFNSQSVADLNRIRSASSTVGGGHAVGLTQLRYHVGYRIKGRTLEDAGRTQECFSGALEFEMVAEPLRVDIAREFVPGTCAYVDILAHEMRHVNTYQQHFAVIAPVIREALGQRFSTTKPFFGDVGGTRAALKAELEGGWIPYLQAAVNAGVTLQEAIDTPEEDARSRLACNGEIERLLNR